MPFLFRRLKPESAQRRTDMDIGEEGFGATGKGEERRRARGDSDPAEGPGLPPATSQHLLKRLRKSWLNWPEKCRERRFQEGGRRRREEGKEKKRSRDERNVAWAARGESDLVWFVFTACHQHSPRCTAVAPQMLTWLN